MKRRLLQSYYSFDLTQKEMGKIRKLRGINTLVNKIVRRPAVRGVIFTSSSIEVNIEASEKRSEAEAKQVQEIIKEELI